MVFEKLLQIERQFNLINVMLDIFGDYLSINWSLPHTHVVIAYRGDQTPNLLQVTILNSSTLFAHVKAHPMCRTSC